MLRPLSIMAPRLAAVLAAVAAAAAAAAAVGGDAKEAAVSAKVQVAGDDGKDGAAEAEPVMEVLEAAAPVVDEAVGKVAASAAVAHGDKPSTSA